MELMRFDEEKQEIEEFVYECLHKIGTAECVETKNQVSQIYCAVILLFISTFLIVYLHKFSTISVLR
jgi:hypothetical protein